MGELSFLHKSPPRLRETALQLKSIPDAHRACQAPIFGAPRKFSTIVANVWNVFGAGKGTHRLPYEGSCPRRGLRGRRGRAGERSTPPPLRGTSPCRGGKNGRHTFLTERRGRYQRATNACLHPRCTGDTPFSPNAGDDIKGQPAPVYTRAAQGTYLCPLKQGTVSKAHPRLLKRHGLSLCIYGYNYTIHYIFKH